VLLLALHNPLDVAEQAVAVDIASNGRLIWPLAGPCHGVLGVWRGKSETLRTYEALEFMQRLLPRASSASRGVLRVSWGRAASRRCNPWPAHLDGAMGPALPRRPSAGITWPQPALADVETYPGCWRKTGGVVKTTKSFPARCAHIADSREQAGTSAKKRCTGAWSSTAAGVNMPLPPVGELRRTPMWHLRRAFAVGTADDVLQALSIYRDEPLDQLGVSFMRRASAPPLPSGPCAALHATSCPRSPPGAHRPRAELRFVDRRCVSTAVHGVRPTPARRNTMPSIELIAVCGLPLIEPAPIWPRW
jgi:hypothetical protein